MATFVFLHWLTPVEFLVYLKDRSSIALLISTMLFWDRLRNRKWGLLGKISLGNLTVMKVFCLCNFFTLSSILSFRVIIYASLLILFSFQLELSY